MTGWFSSIFGANTAKARTPPRSTGSAASSPTAKRADRTPTPSRPTEPFGPPSIRREIETISETVTAAADTVPLCFPEVLRASANAATATASTAITAGIASTAITAGTETTTLTLRSAEAVQKERDKHNPDVDFGGMPMGPFPTEELLMDAIQIWAHNKKSDNGSFHLALRSCTLVPQGKTKGASRLIRCDHYGEPVKQGGQVRNNTITKKTNCKWAIRIEHCCDGWRFASMPKQCMTALKENIDLSASSIHNHHLLQTTEESNTNAKLRCMTDDQKACAELLFRCGNPPERIHLMLSRECHLKGLPVEFTAKDISNMFGTSVLDKSLDCSNLLEHLQDRLEEDSSLKYYFKLDSDGILDRVFFVLPGAQAKWAKAKHAVLLYDTKHGTNKYGLKVGVLTFIDENGVTQILAVSILRHEDTETFTWVFDKFCRSVGPAPVVCFTDSDDAMARAIKAAWPFCRHLLCTFHLWKNFFQHIHPLFISKPEEWKIVAHRWWELCKNSDKVARITFVADWAGLSEYILQKASGTPENIAKQKKWLDKMGPNAKQWAACYTWDAKTYGIHSTARAEAIHSVMVRWCSKHSSIVDLVHDLERMSENRESKSETNALRTQLNNVMGLQPTIYPPAAILAKKMTDYSARALKAQAAQIILYSHRTEDELPLDERLTAEERIELNFDSEETVLLVEILSDVLASSDLSDEEQRRAVDHGLQQEPKKRCHWTSVKRCTCQYEECMGVPCRHMLYVAMASRFAGPLRCDPFWLMETQTKRIAHSEVSGSTTRRLPANADTIPPTMAARRELLMSTSGVVIDIACASEKATRELLTALLHQGEALGVNGQPGGAVPQPASLAALTTLANVAQSAAASKDADSSSSGENITVASLKRPAVAKARNPPNKGKAQNQARHQPVTGPTSKGSKTRSRSMATRSKLTRKGDS
jgi:hypothetical protein